jgi:type II secretory pathway component GspD/PulD (secretin)
MSCAVGMTPRICVGVVALALACAGQPAFGLEPKWSADPYKYIVVDQDLKAVLTEFGRNLDIAVEVSDQVKGRMRGRLPAGTAEQFLSALCESYGLVWYFDGAALHVSAKSESKTELVDVGQLPAADLKALPDKLEKLGIADRRFPLRTTDNVGVISVSGPPTYVSLVRQTLAAMIRSATPPAPEGNQKDEVGVRVFRGGSAAVPGLASTDPS